MDLAEVINQVRSHLNTEFLELGSKNTMAVECIHDGKYWISDPNHWNFRAASKAVEEVFHHAPDMIREGGSIPITLIFEQALGKNVVLIPMGACDDGAHSINEKIDKENFLNGIKLYGAYLNALAQTKME